MPTDIHAPLLAQVAAHPRLPVLCCLVRECLSYAAARRSTDLAALIADRCRDHALTKNDADTPAGNVIEALEHLLDDPSAPALVATLAARALASEPPQGVEAEDRNASDLVWIATSLGVDVLAAIDELEPSLAPGLWGAVGDIVQRHDARGAGIPRAEAIVAAASLAASEHETARARRAQLAESVRTPTLKRVLAGGSSGAVAQQGEALVGELQGAPRGAAATFFLGLVGWLLVSNVARLIGRYALQYSRPAEVSVTAKGVVVRSKTRLLGKVLRETETVMPVEGLARATREVRFPRAATYAGIASLAVGSYVGVSWLVDGVRAASFSLVAVGLLVMAAGIGLDFVLRSVLPGRKGQCRVVFVPKRGAIMCVGGVDAVLADAMMKGLVSGK